MSKLAALSYTLEAHRNSVNLLGLLQHSQLADDSNWAGLDIACLHMIIESIAEKADQLKFEVEQECETDTIVELPQSTEIVDHGIIATNVRIGDKMYSIRKIEYK